MSPVWFTPAEDPRPELFPAGVAVARRKMLPILNCALCPVRAASGPQPLVRLCRFWPLTADSVVEQPARYDAAARPQLAEACRHIVCGARR